MTSPRNYRERSRRRWYSRCLGISGALWCSACFLYEISLTEIGPFRNLHDLFEPTDRTLQITRPFTRKYDVRATNNSRHRPISITPISATEVQSTQRLPTWMTEYLRWHKQEKEILNATNWDQHKFLVMHCLHTDSHCGGLSDRLQKIPAAILIASQYKRILLIKWERPARLEEFLVPPLDGLDWRIPPWLDDKLPLIRKAHILSSNHFENHVDSTNTVIQMKHQSSDHGAAYYNKHARKNGDPNFLEVFHSCWSMVFEPSPPVAALVDRHMQQLQLTSRKYASVHVRSKYQRDKSRRLSLVHNAVNCSSQLAPGIPIFITADSNEISQAGVVYGKKQGGTVVTTSRTNEPLHLDRGSHFLGKREPDWQRFAASAFYDIFVDLYILARSRCVVYHVGGFGRLGSLMSMDYACRANHGNQRCEWRGTPQNKK